MKIESYVSLVWKLHLHDNPFSQIGLLICGKNKYSIQQRLVVKGCQI